MGRPITYKNAPAGPANRWVRDALAFAEMGQAEVARLLAEKGIGSGDRSIVQKMTTNRRVQAMEMLAISEITGFPVPADRAAFETLSQAGKLSPTKRARLAGYLDALAHEEDG